MKKYLLLAFWGMSQIAYSSSIENFVEARFNDGHIDDAMRFLDILEEENNPEGLYYKGLLYLIGCYGAPDSRMATIYFARAAALNFPAAMRALADSYLEGDGAEKDPYQAFYYYKKAADLGDGPAQFNLAILYRDGIGVKQSFKKAIEYFEKASKNPQLGEMREDAQLLADELKM